MSNKTVIVKLTQYEANALWQLAGCAANTEDDALQVVDNMRAVNAGYRALDKLHEAMSKAQRQDAVRKAQP